MKRIGSFAQLPPATLALVLVLASCGDHPEPPSGSSYPYLDRMESLEIVREVTVDHRQYAVFQGERKMLLAATQEIPADLFARFLNKTKYGEAMPSVVARLGELSLSENGQPIKTGEETNVFIIDFPNSNPVRRGTEYVAQGEGECAATGITLYGARAFCKWYSQQNVFSWRLPTPEEWLGVANAREPTFKGMPGGPLEWCASMVQFGKHQKWAVMGGEWHMRRKMSAEGIAYALPTLRGRHEQPISFRLFADWPVDDAHTVAATTRFDVEQPPERDK